MTPRITIVVPVRNRVSLTQQCVEGLVSSYGSREDVEVVVVDDGSTDKTPEFLEAAGVGVVRHAESAGFAASCNDGAAAGSGDFIVFLNNDTIGEEGWLDALVAYADAHSRAAVVGARLLYQNRTIQHAGIVFGADLVPRHVYRGFPGEHQAVSKPRRFQAVTAACMLVRRTVFEEGNGFDTDFVNGFEDVDLCLRIAQQGGEIHYCPDSILVHFEAITRRGHPDHFQRNLEHLLERWRDQIRRDDLEIYAEDGLLELMPGDLYPLDLRVDPLLAAPLDGDPYAVLGERSRQVFDLLKENVGFRVRLDDIELKSRARLMASIGPDTKGDAFPPAFTEFLSFEARVFGQPAPIAAYDPYLIRYGEYRFILDVVAPKRGDIVIDLGCEANLLMLFLGSRGANVIGIDVDSNLGALVKERKDLVHRATGIDPSVCFDVQDATDLSVEESSADFVIATSSIEHMFSPRGDGDVLAIDGIARVLRPGGLAAITVPMSNGAPFHECPSGDERFAGPYRLYSPEALRERLLSHPALETLRHAYLAQTTLDPRFDNMAFTEFWQELPPDERLKWAWANPILSAVFNPILEHEDGDERESTLNTALLLLRKRAKLDRRFRSVTGAENYPARDRDSKRWLRMQRV
jgi:GT2 family glycosyltransferase/SAM-dependent methyltransferase